MRIAEGGTLHPGVDIFGRLTISRRTSISVFFEELLFTRTYYYRTKVLEDEYAGTLISPCCRAGNRWQ
jgi:hypothetical protein